MGASDPLRTGSRQGLRVGWLLPVGSQVKAWAWAGVVLAAAMLVVLGGSTAVAAAVTGPAPVVTVGMVSASAPPVSVLDLRGCTGTANNPHPSTGAGGIIFKMRLACRTSRTVDLLQGRLYKCPERPTGSHTGWPRQGCVTPGNEIYDDEFVSGGSTGETWYVPRWGEPGVHGRGYWVGVAFWRDQGWTITDYSQVVYLDR